MHLFYSYNDELIKATVNPKFTYVRKSETKSII